MSVLLRFMALWMGVTTVTCTLQGAEANPRPNIILILLDDLRGDALGCTGHPFVKTPGIDRIAREGAMFTNAFVTTPLCFPSRASCLTGQYVHRHGIRLAPDRARLSHQMVTFPLLLQRAGYETAFIGKWHLMHDDKAAPGIDRWVSFRDQGEFVDPELNLDGRFVKAKGYLTDLLTDHAVEFIKRPRARPFLIHLAHKAVHAPFIPADRHKHLFADIPITPPASANDDWSGKPVLKRPGVTLQPKDSDTTTTEANIRDQLRCLIAVDESVIRLFEALEATHQLDHTMIVFSSDNGYFWREHGGLGGKHGPYEESIRVPLLMRDTKRIKPGLKLDALALNIDLAPTFLEAAGVPVPAEIQGLSLLPLFSDPSKRLRSSFLAEFFLGNGTPRFPTWQAVRTERWKYVRYPDFEGMEELYDLKNDPTEMKNLVRDSSSENVQREMTTELERLLRGEK
jgi:arylsulfatase A-like enzyme